MPFTADEATAYADLSNDLSGTRTKCVGTSIKWCRGVIIRAGAVAFQSGSCYSGSDDNKYPKWVAEYATNKYSRRDAEIKVLCDLEYGNLQANDLVVLLGDDGPCASCRAVIRKYAQYYRGLFPVGFLLTAIYTKAAYTVQSNIWPNGCLYGSGNPITDQQNLYYVRV